MNITSGEQANSIVKPAWLIASKLGLLILIGLFIIYSTSLDGFIHINNSSAIIGLIALGSLFVYLAGYIDLSVGAFFALYVLLYYYLQTHLGTYTAFLALMVCALIIGFINGCIVTSFGKHLSPLITLCMLFIVRGYVHVLSSKMPQNSTLDENTFLLSLEWETVVFFSHAFWLYVATLLGVYLVIAKTHFGLSLTAIGLYKSKAEPIEIRSKYKEIFAFSISACFIALTSVLFLSKVSNISTLAGTGFELDILIILIISTGFFVRKRANVVNLFMCVLALTYIEHLSITLTLTLPSIYLLKSSLLMMALYIELYQQFNRNRA